MNELEKNKVLWRADVHSLQKDSDDSFLRLEINQLFNGKIFIDINVDGKYHDLFTCTESIYYELKKAYENK
jgi:hypothetical protein